MSKIAFFCIPAQGHTNPTLGVVRELVARGNEVWYYSYDLLRERIEETGATYVSCDSYDAQERLKPEDGERIGKDIAFSTKILVDTTLALDEAILEDMQAWQPDCIVADSMAMWGKLVAEKLQVPFVSSTTTFAFNRYSSRIMKQSLWELFGVLRASGRAKRELKRLQDKGYPEMDILSVVQNDNATDTIVYTSREFQPFAETFSDKYVFVGPSIRPVEQPVEKKEKKLIYISMGTVNNQKTEFFRNCIEAFRDKDCQVLLSVGELVDLDALGNLPEHIRVERRVDQIAVLQQTDVFLTHCGMNSVSEALYYRVPLVLLPQTKEQSGVAFRVQELGAGLALTKETPEMIFETVKTVLEQSSYREAAGKIADGFHRCGGAAAAADKILEVAGATEK